MRLFMRFPLYFCLLLSPLIVAEGGQANELAGYVDMAIANDQRIAQARARITASEAGVSAANAPRRPQVSVGGTYSWTEQREPLELDYNNAEAALDLQQSLWQRNQLARRDLAKLQVEATGIEVARATRNLLGELSEAFFDLLNQRREIAVYRAQLNALDNALQREESRFAAGVSSTPRLNAVRAEHAQVNASLVMAEALLVTYQDVLVRLVGEEIDLPEAGKTPEFSLPAGDAHIWRDRAARQNQDLRLADNAIAQANQGITLAQRGNDPSLNLFGRWARASNPNGMELVNEFQQVGVRLNVPLYTGGGVSASTTQAEQDYLAAQLARDYQADLLASSVRLRWRQLESQLAVIEANEVALLSAEQSLELNQVAYSNNALGQQELLDAQSRFYVAERKLAASRYDFSRRLIDLYALAGELDKARLLKVIGDWL